LYKHHPTTELAPVVACPSWQWDGREEPRLLERTLSEQQKEAVRPCDYTLVTNYAWNDEDSKVLSMNTTAMLYRSSICTLPIPMDHVMIVVLTSATWLKQ
jgi:hypothetical protein